ncbi:MAG: DUF1464 family protein [Synergistetes bacterium]|nr:DUF1464 family protein [Synergistota bacterium]
MKLKGVTSLSGIPEIEREIDDSLMPVIARVYGSLNEGRYILVNLDDPFFVCAVDYGEIVDCVSSTELGAFSLRTCGELPTAEIAKAAVSDPDSWRKKLLVEGGLYSYLSTDNLDEALKMDSFIVEAMAYQMNKEIWAMCTALSGEVDAIVCFGRLLKNRDFWDMLRRRIEPLKMKIIEMEVV